jgi:hypothetical protein
MKAAERDLVSGLVDGSLRGAETPTAKVSRRAYPRYATGMFQGVFTPRRGAAPAPRVAQVMRLAVQSAMTGGDEAGESDRVSSAVSGADLHGEHRVRACAPEGIPDNLPGDCRVRSVNLFANSTLGVNERE